MRRRSGPGWRPTSFRDWARLRRRQSRRPRQRRDPRGCRSRRRSSHRAGPSMSGHRPLAPVTQAPGPRRRTGSGAAAAATAPEIRLIRAPAPSRVRCAGLRPPWTAPPHRLGRQASTTTTSAPGGPEGRTLDGSRRLWALSVAGWQAFLPCANARLPLEVVVHVRAAAAQPLPSATATVQDEEQRPPTFVL